MRCVQVSSGRVASIGALNTTPLTARNWLICIGLSSIVLWADEAKKLLERRNASPPCAS